MTHERDIERLLDLWLSDGPTESPDRVTEVVADRIERQSQRPAWRLDWRPLPMNAYAKFAVAAAAVLIVAVVAYNLLPGGSSSIGGPAATPTFAPSPAPPTPSPVIPSATVAAGVPGACDLMTAAEAADTLHAADVSSGSLGADSPTTPSRYCGFDAGGKELVVLAYEKDNGASIFGTWKQGTGVKAVSGIGDDAVWDPTQATLYILKGDRLVTIETTVPTLTLAQAKAIGAIVVGRM